MPPSDQDTGSGTTEPTGDVAIEKVEGEPTPEEQAAAAEQEQQNREQAERYEREQADAQAAADRERVEHEEAVGAILTDVSAPDQPLREAVDADNAELEPGQTITTTTDGRSVVTGTPKPESVEVAHTLEHAGDYIGVETPLGRVVLGLEVDAQGTIFVTHQVSSFDGGNVVESDGVLLRHRTS